MKTLVCLPKTAWGFFRSITRIQWGLLQVTFLAGDFIRHGVMHKPSSPVDGWSGLLEWFIFVVFFFSPWQKPEASEPVD